MTRTAIDPSGSEIRWSADGDSIIASQPVLPVLAVPLLYLLYLVPIVGLARVGQLPPMLLSFLVVGGAVLSVAVRRALTRSVRFKAGAVEIGISLGGAWLIKHKQGDVSPGDIAGDAHTVVLRRDGREWVLFRANEKVVREVVQDTQVACRADDFATLEAHMRVRRGP